jgi:glutathione S-transferase
MSKLVFYSNPQSRGTIAHWMLEELGEPYETVWLGYAGSMKAPEYLAVNPMGKVPAVKDGDAVVTEAAAICAYLADRFPDAKLAPPPGDPARAAYYRWMFFAAGPVEQAVTCKAMNWEVPGEKSGFVGFGSYDATIAALESALSPGPYICGEQFTAADVYVGSAIRYGMMFGTLDERPAFVDYVARLDARPAYARSVAINAERIARSKKG